MKRIIEKELRGQKKALLKQLRNIKKLAEKAERELDKTPRLVYIHAAIIRKEAEDIMARLWIIKVLEGFLEKKYEGKNKRATGKNR